MIIERDTVGRFRRTQDKRFYFFESELADGRLVRAQRKYWWPARTFRSLRSQSKKKPAGVLNLGKLSWWLYKGKVYLTQGHPRPTEVSNFLEMRKALADFFKQPVFPVDAAFQMKTIGKRKPPRVPVA